MSRQEDGFLARWSRRKRTVDPPGDELDIEPTTQPPADERSPEETGPQPTDAEILETLGLEDPDTLGPGDDFRAFMQKAVPEHLRRRALRRLWTSNPVLANLDGLNDYDGDFTGGGVPAGTLKTVYQVGLGAVRDVARAADARTAEVEAVPENEANDAPDAAESVANSEAEPDAEDHAEECADTAAIPRRRMRFRFES